MKIDGMLDRKCCDLCGFNEEAVFNLFSGEHSCPICGYEFDDYALLHPDARDKRRVSLNNRRFDWFVRSKNKGAFQKLFRGLNYIAGFNLWREMHPELASRFDMCDFKEHPEFFERLLSMNDYFGEDVEE